jgi:hypothetical protein
MAIRARYLGVIIIEELVVARKVEHCNNGAWAGV